jgi:hypothetical protein
VVRRKAKTIVPVNASKAPSPIPFIANSVFFAKSNFFSVTT